MYGEPYVTSKHYRKNESLTIWLRPYGTCRGNVDNGEPDLITLCEVVNAWWWFRLGYLPQTIALEINRDWLRTLWDVDHVAVLWPGRVEFIK